MSMANDRGSATVIFPSQWRTIGTSAVTQNNEWEVLAEQPALSTGQEHNLYGASPDDKALQEDDMNDLSKGELEARLAANKAEVEAVAAEMRREMADFRTHYTQQFSSIDKGLAEIKGDIGGIKTSLNTTQWAMTIGLALVTVVLSGVMLVSSWIISNSQSTASPARQLESVQSPQSSQPKPQ
ncbi:TPA: hypothetical protein U2L63_004402 [Citrobacter braakii]|uniref:hypothetical protein n=1 Tax=Citrobacter sp. Cb220 TaxID=2985034 RepID=UPI00257914E5|nr:hypothetical protein [Citrobacter sp. Cb220]MDM3316398.1 hypothetical protein [Citrobacter sp. Cb220]HEM7929930.1 hypothetical protein [Citrobacter braakii]HEM7959566.1 hypothetical protein [Citrobacter braakii]